MTSHSSRPAFTLLLACSAASCSGYSPEPVDLAAHARVFAARRPANGIENAHRGLDLAHARRIALVLHPDLRTERARLGVTAASRAEAGRYLDPELTGDFAKILESVSHPWLAAGALGLTLPLSGRLGLQKAEADAEHELALLEARSREAKHVLELEAAWVRWSASEERVRALADLVARLRALEAVATRLAEAGEITHVAARALSLERLARELEAEENAGASVGLRLEVAGLLGLAPEAAPGLVPTLTITPRIAEPAARRDALLTSPLLAVRGGEHEVAERRLELALRERWPDLKLAPGFAEEDAQPRLSLGISLALPLWNANARAIATARATRALAAENLRGEYEREAGRLARAEARLAAARQRLARVERELVPLTERQFADAQRLAELGNLEPLLILDALIRVHSARSAALDARVEVALATCAVNAHVWPDETVAQPSQESR